ncbi:MAG TPA: isocitrate lyase/phosphoenolpyruvate mutase family protein [Candidatus Limnocylindria bacterium]
MGGMSQSERVASFHALHESGCFVIPNPWDAGTAVALEQMGFLALATTSAGLAWSLGRADNQITLAVELDHLRAVCAAVSIPVNADFEGGFAVEPDGVAANVTAAIETGIAGLSIEDSTRDADAPLLDLPLAVERIRAARAAIDASGTGVILVGRSEGYVVGRPDLDDTIRRLVAYSEAGADCLYAPRLRTADEIRAVVEAVAPKPVNVLAGSEVASVGDMAALGVRRISVGGQLARAAWAGFLAAATEIAEAGTFGWLEHATPGADLDARFSED